MANLAVEMAKPNAGKEPSRRPAHTVLGNANPVTVNELKPGHVPIDAAGNAKAVSG
jgi:hypothetical protein